MGEPPEVISIPPAGARSPAGLCRFSHEAMATTFEVLIAGQESGYARQAAWAAFDEIDRLELELSRFIDSSDVAQIGRLRPGETLRVGIATIECLEQARRINAETGGAFDVTVGALVDRQGGRGARGGNALPAGMDLLAVDAAACEVAVTAEGVKVDLGGIGKGHAVDAVAAMLAEWSVDCALVCAGGSTVLATGPAGGGTGWPIELRDPLGSDRGSRLVLRDRALSASGTRVKGCHIVDPRTGGPVHGRAGAWAAAPSATVADALSTAFMVMSAEEVAAYCGEHADVSAMLWPAGPAGAAGLAFGSWDQ